MDILRIFTLLTGLRRRLPELDDHRCCQDRWQNRAALHAIDNLSPSAQPDCLRQRPIHPQQAAARAGGHINLLRGRRAGDRPTMTPGASAKGAGEGSTHGHPSFCASAAQIRATIAAKTLLAGFTAYASSPARLSLGAVAARHLHVTISVGTALNELLRRCRGEGDRKHPKDCECPIYVCSPCSVERFRVGKVDAGVQVAGRRPM